MRDHPGIRPNRLLATLLVDIEEPRVIGLLALEQSMPTCLNCDSVVTESYVRVFAPNGMTQPRVCPNCKDKVREQGDVRAKKN